MYIYIYIYIHHVLQHLIFTIYMYVNIYETMKIMYPQEYHQNGFVVI